MSKPTFTTYWTIDEQRYTELAEVSRLVFAGAVAAETSIEAQHAAWEHQQLLEAWHRRALDRHAKYVAEQQHKDSPEGKLELVARHAAQHPGGIVTTTGRNSVFDELDAFGPDKTDVFK